MAAYLWIAAVPLALADSAFPTGESLSWQDTRMLMAEYCFDCHGGFLTEGNVDLVAAKFERSVAETPEMWENAAKALRIHYMPQEEAMPVERREALIRSIDARLLQAAQLTRPDHTTMRRLNRYEFANTLNDLLLIDFPARARLPADDSGYGFDNNADVLSVSPLLLEKYLSVSAEAAEWAVPLRVESRKQQFTGAEFAAGFEPAEGFSRKIYAGGMSNAARISLNLMAGEYRAKLYLAGDQAGDEYVRVRMYSGDEPPREVEVPSDDVNSPTVVDLNFSVRKSEPYHLAIELANDYYDDSTSPPSDRNLYVVGLDLDGPYQTAEGLYSPFLERHFGGALEQLKPAEIRAGIQRFASRAYRRPVTSEELNSLWHIYQEEFARTGQSPRRALHAVMDTVMASPNFIFRWEPREAVSEYGLASWLSYFLWGSMPDDRLFELARKNELRTQLNSEIQRMLQDPRAATLTEEFAAQWLQFRDLWNLQVDPKSYPAYSDQLQAAMWQETTRFFADLIQRDGSIMRILDADYTFANPLLAKHYGLKDAPKKDFQRVSLEGTDRRGIWSQAGVLTVTSHPDRTSPVLRGKFILENLLGMAPPPPPANIPSLSAKTDHPTPADFRESLALHRADPNCASCHNILDPIGLSLESYDGIGARRQEPMVAETLFDGTVIDGPDSLVAYLVETRRDEFVATFAEKLTTYATGRGVNWRDRPALERIVQETESQDFRISALITAVVEHYAPGRPAR
ncbi:filamin [Cerasicoccus arenae]|uniref:Filamin n=1 Tax=Cerasicoccus arenae TaxID=424488 RepID=A0A8J3GDA0_9BACT|nr:filamin [Cerasicoccus arenae]